MIQSGCERKHLGLCLTLTCLLWSMLAFPVISFAQPAVKIGLNYPKTGAYAEQGLAQARAALMAVDEINEAGGIAGRKIELVMRNSASQVERTKKNVDDLVNNHDVSMIFGGSSSAVAIAGGQQAKLHDRLYFGTLTYSNATTREKGHTHMFRETYNAWMAAKVLSKYLLKNHGNERYFYLTADYTWGWSTEQSMRLFTNTEDKDRHAGTLTSFPRPRASEIRAALEQAKASGAKVLVLVQFGKDMVTALDLAHVMGLQKDMTIIVPSLTLGMAKFAGPFTMQGIIGAVPWVWKVPYQYSYPRGIAFVEDFKARYEDYPSSSAASAYSILWEYKAAVERAGTFNTKKVIAALEGHSYEILKDQQTWRKFDHQSVQSVYAVRIKPRDEIVKNDYHADFFEIVETLPAKEAAQSFEEWSAARRAAGLSSRLN